LQGVATPAGPPVTPLLQYLAKSTEMARRGKILALNWRAAPRLLIVGVIDVDLINKLHESNVNLRMLLDELD